MQKNKSWFEVDKEGLKQLQDGKPKFFVVRELLQNAFDEDVSEVTLNMQQQNGKATITVTDNSPEGFKDLADAYTLYKYTTKRKNASQRGRFNLGEKQVFSICDSAKIVTTKGGLVFDKTGRKTLREKTIKGSVITTTLKMNREEFDMCVNFVNNVKYPEGLYFDVVTIVNGKTTFIQVPYTIPIKNFGCKLKTELEDDEGVWRKRLKETTVFLYEEDESFLYELGLPVCPIECEYSIDVQQKIPLDTDRDKVDQTFLKHLFGEVLEHTIEDLQEEHASEGWVQTGFVSGRISGETGRSVLTKRFGEKRAIFNPHDPNANDEAISKGYKVIHGRELSGDAWNTVKGISGMESTTALFGMEKTGYKSVEPTEKQKRVGKFAQWVAKEFLNFELNVKFISSPLANTLADFSGSHLLRFNIARIKKSWWEEKDKTVNEDMLDLIVHELGHVNGKHTEHSYHDTITRLAAKLILRARKDPNCFVLI